MLTSLLTVKRGVILGFRFDVLNLLAERKLRPSEIRKILHPKYKKRWDSDRSFDVIISRELKDLSNLINRVGKGHQPVFYSLNKKGFEELKRIRLKNRVNNWIDKMTIDEIRVWLNRIESRGSRLRFTDGPTVRSKDGKIKGKGIGLVWDSLKYGTSFTMIVKDKNGKKIQEIETDEDGKMRYIIKDGKKQID